MSYDRYVAGVLKRRHKREEEYREKNILREQSKLPRYNSVTQPIEDFPIMSRAAWEEEQAYRKFYREERKKYPSQEDLLEGVTSHMSATARGLGIDAKIKLAWEDYKRSKVAA